MRGRTALLERYIARERKVSKDIVRLGQKWSILEKGLWGTYQAKTKRLGINP